MEKVIRGNTPDTLRGVIPIDEILIDDFSSEPQIYGDGVLSKR